MSQVNAQRLTTALDGNPLAISIAADGIKRGAFKAEDILRMVETAGRSESPNATEANTLEGRSTSTETT